MDPRHVLAKLREGQPLTDAELAGFAVGLAEGSVSDSQGGAFAMGVCKAGLSEAETVALTIAMRDSGRVLSWDLPGPVVDKHSTGGLGDSTSLVVAPVVAALGAYAPFMSGRGLGHTGGTLDKMEAVAGVDTTVSGARLQRLVAEVGCAVVGASDTIAPADRRLYALRDETATVESQALITASILSKKLAAGARALILDVKGGSGAFMKTPQQARDLAQALTRAANGAGCATRALITDMNQPLAPAVGNAVELHEVLKVLRDPRPDSRLCQLSLALIGELLELAGAYATPESAAQAALEVLQNGQAAERFERMMHALGGPADLLDDPDGYLPAAPVIRPVAAGTSGHVCAIDGVSLGEVVRNLGGGRRHAGDAIDPRVGLTEVVLLGQRLGPRDALCLVHAATEADAEDATDAIRRAIQVGEKTATPPLIHERVNA
ncbi:MULTISPECIES: thymidine phosphorylase [unclassified Meridianimarinicoccus]|uniref:thymidine phosphorylase n=1 Tax=unclassified Meridianimarinicoccus TaxID=2923344 RepID=UPI0018692C56|nr:thymidine phosphorylase [Fluviibacterium sp. MJW13]